MLAVFTAVTALVTGPRLLPGCAADARACVPTMADAPEVQTLAFKLGKLGDATLRYKPTIAESKPVIIAYPIPFDLSVEPSGGRAVCTKAGPGGEQVGDVLRYCTKWELGLPKGGGVASTVASFAGGLSWQIGLFDVDKAASFEEVVEALVSNTPERTDFVTLVWERPAGATAEV